MINTRSRVQANVSKMKGAFYISKNLNYLCVRFVFEHCQIFKCSLFLSYPILFLSRILKRKDCLKEIVEVTITS